MSSAKKRNAFYYFMVSRKSELEAQGVSFPQGLRDVATYVDAEWKNMDLKQRKNFDHDKKMEPKTPDDPPKFANPTERMRWETKKKMELEQSLAVDIGNFLQKQKDTIEDIKFVIIDFNVWGTNKEGLYVPAEIGLVAFSLREGVIDNYGNLIDPRKIDLGMGFDVFRSVEEFDLPQPPFDYDLEGKNIQYLMNCIFWFTNKYIEKIGPGQLFCLRESTDIVNGCLNWLCKQTGLPHEFTVYPLEHLVVKLGELREEKPTDEKRETSPRPSTSAGLTATKTTAAKPVASTSEERSWSFKFWREDPPMDMDFEEIRRKKWEKVQSDDPPTLTEEEKARYMKCLDPPVVDPLVEVRNLLNGVSLYGSKHLACFHHMQNWNVVHKCALSKVNGYAYHTLGYLLPKFEIPVQPSSHYPDDSMVEHETVVHTLMLRNWGLEPQEYPSYVDADTRKEMEVSNSALLDSLSPLSDKVKLKDLPMSMIPPLWRPKPPSPTFKLISSESIKIEKGEKK